MGSGHRGEDGTAREPDRRGRTALPAATSVRPDIEVLPDIAVLEPQLGDAVGEMLRTLAERGSAVELIERSDAKLSSADAGWYLDPPELWPAMERWALGQVHGRTLDIGCGAGRHTLALQELDIDVVAIDSSAGAVDVSTQRGARNAICADVHALPDELGRFDTFLLLGFNLGLLGDATTGRRLLHRLAERAEPGAALIGQSAPALAASDDLEAAYQRANAAAGRLPGANRIRLRFRNLATPWFDYLRLSLDELEAVIGSTPWETVAHRSDGESYIVQLRRR